MTETDLDSLKGLILTRLVTAIVNLKVASFLLEDMSKLG